MKIKISLVDRLFSVFIRSRAEGKCERCLRSFEMGRLECSHFHGRRKQSVRFSPDNAVALCFNCHRYFEENPWDHVEFFKKRLGKKRFAALQIIAEIPQKQDYKLLAIFWKEVLREKGLYPFKKQSFGPVIGARAK